MIFFTGQQDYLNLVIVQWTCAINMMQEDETLDKNCWYPIKVLIVELFHVRAFDDL